MLFVMCLYVKEGWRLFLDMKMNLLYDVVVKYLKVI